MRRAARVDANQREITAALRKVGATVQLLHTIGAGCPDLLVGYRGRNWLLEVKTKDGKLTLAEENWMWCWRGHYAEVRTVDEALLAIKI